MNSEKKRAISQALLELGNFLEQASKMLNEKEADRAAFKGAEWLFAFLRVGAAAMLAPDDGNVIQGEASLARVIGLNADAQALSTNKVPTEHRAFELLSATAELFHVAIWTVPEHVGNIERMVQDLEKSTNA